MPDNTVKLINTIICDDIRREDNGKFIFIGVYPEIIIMRTIPAQLILSIWMQFRMNIKREITLEFEIKGSALKNPIAFSYKIGNEKMFNKNETVPLVIKLPIEIHSIGNFSIYYRKSGDKDWLPSHKAVVNNNPALIPR